MVLLRKLDSVSKPYDLVLFTHVITSSNLLGGVDTTIGIFGADRSVRVFILQTHNAVRLKWVWRPPGGLPITDSVRSSHSFEDNRG